MKTKIIIIVLALIVISCNPQRPIFSGSDFTGSKGLNFYFDVDAPPNYVYEDSKFSARVLVENVGAANVDNAAYVLGVEDQYANFEQKTGMISLYGKSFERPYGDKTHVLLDGEAKSLGTQMEGLTTTLSFSMCYPYTTQAEVSTCIDTKPLSKEKKVCIVKEHSFNAGQAAPLGVVKVIPRMVVSDNGVKPQYEITVKNLDEGEILSKDYVYSYCLGKSIPKDAYNVVEVEVFLHKEKNKEQLDCTKKKLSLKEGSDTLFCESKREVPSLEGTYNAPLIVRLNYGYAQTITKKVRIQSKN